MFLIICKFFILLNKKKISKNCQKFFFSYFQKYQIIFHKLKIDFFLIFYNIFMYILGIIIFFYKIYTIKFQKKNNFMFIKKNFSY